MEFKLAVGAAALLAFASLHAQTVPVEQFGLTAVNSNGNALYNVTVTPNTPATTGALITGTAVLNTDAAAQGSFFAVARVPNSVTSAMDLIVADAENGRILRYPGPGPASYAVATPIFTWSHHSPGPKYPLSLSSDVAGNLFIVSSGVPFDTRPALWVLPFNATTGAYGAPILIDNTCGIVTEVLVATTAATPVGTAAPAWNVGDVLVLSNDIFNARVTVYSQAAIQSVLANPSRPLNNPTSTAVGPSLLHGALPLGMDIWPADATHGVSLLLTTLGGRVMRFDSGSGAMTADFASGLGVGLQRIKVGTYSTLTYAFVSQFTPGRGKILQFGAPPASGANLPLASLSTGNKDPQGLATSSSGSVPVSACVAPSACAPLGPQLTTQLSGAGSSTLPTGSPLLEESCGRHHLELCGRQLGCREFLPWLSEHRAAGINVRPFRTHGCGIRGCEEHRKDGRSEREQYIFPAHGGSERPPTGTVESDVSPVGGFCLGPALRPALDRRHHRRRRPRARQQLLHGPLRVLRQRRRQQPRIVHDGVWLGAQ